LTICSARTISRPFSPLYPAGKVSILSDILIFLPL
jgi:hypothetical protein